MAVLLGNSIPLYYPGKHDPQIHHQRNNSLTVWQSQPSQMAGKVEVIFQHEMNCDVKKTLLRMKERVHYFDKLCSSSS